MSTTLFRLEHIQADDTGEIQTVQAYGHAGERLEDIIRVQPHGFTSNPPVGSHGLGLRLRGESDLVAVLGLEHQDKRPKNIAPGNSIVYDAAGNASRYLGDDGIWHDAGSRTHKLTGKTVTITASDKPASIGSKNDKTYLGGDGADGGTYAPVMTTSGPSSVVFAKL